MSESDWPLNHLTQHINAETTFSPPAQYHNKHIQATSAKSSYTLHHPSHILLNHMEIEADFMKTDEDCILHRQSTLKLVNIYADCNKPKRPRANLITTIQPPAKTCSTPKEVFAYVTMLHLCCIHRKTHLCWNIRSQLWHVIKRHNRHHHHHRHCPVLVDFIIMILFDKSLLVLLFYIYTDVYIYMWFLSLQS